MHIETLLRFCTIVDSGSFSKAAEVLFCSQPALSKQVSSLERELGYPLFHRAGKKLTLNQNGERLYQFGRKLEQDYAQLCSDLYELNHPHRHDVNFGVTNHIGVYLLPPILRRFTARQPDIPVRFTVDFLPKLLDMLKQDVISFAMVPEHDKFLQDPMLLCRPFAQDRLLVVLPRGHPLSEQPAVEPDELANYPFLVSRAGSATRSFFLSALQQNGVHLGETLDLYNTETIKQSILQGLGISILPAAAVSAELRAGLLHALPLSGIDLTRTLYLVRKKNRPLSLEDSLMFSCCIDPAEKI